MDSSNLLLLEIKARELLAPGESRNQISVELLELLDAIPALIVSLQTEREKRAEAEALLKRFILAHEETTAAVQKVREFLGSDGAPRDLRVGDQVTKAAWGTRRKTILLMKQTTTHGMVAVFVEGGWSSVEELARVE